MEFLLELRDLLLERLPFVLQRCEILLELCDLLLKRLPFALQRRTLLLELQDQLRVLPRRRFKQVLLDGLALSQLAQDPVADTIRGLMISTETNRTLAFVPPTTCCSPYPRAVLLLLDEDTSPRWCIPLRNLLICP